jgi:hypothetical protein
MTEKNKQTTQDTSGVKFLVITIVLVILLIAGVFVYTYLNSRPEPTTTDRYADVLNGVETNESYLYNGFVFLYNGFLWETKILIDENYLEEPIEAALSTYYDPKSLENISIEGNVAHIDSVSTVYLAFSPDLDSTQVLAGVEVGKIVSKKFNIFNKDVIHGVYEPYNGSFPLVTCDNATGLTMVAEFKITNQTQIVQDGGCLSFQGESSEDLLRAADRYIFRLLRVMVE